MRLWRVALLVLVAAVGGVGTALLYHDVESSERALSRAAFKGLFSVVLESFASYMLTQLVALSAIADSVGTDAAEPSVEKFNTVRNQARAQGGTLGLPLPAPLF